jgi:hypothetical protein
MSTQILFSMQTNEASAIAVQEELSRLPSTECHASERKNLDGSTAAWIVVANLAAQSLPHVLTFIKDLLVQRPVKKIKFGDLEIENPTAEDLAYVREVFRARVAAELQGSAAAMVKPDDD